MFYLGRLFLFVAAVFIAACGSASAQRCPTPNPNITAGVAGHPFFDGCPLPAGALNNLPVFTGTPPISGNIATWGSVPGTALVLQDSGISSSALGLGTQTYSAITAGYAQFLRDFSLHYWDQANVIQRLRPVGATLTTAGYVNNALPNLNGSFWMMVEAENLMYWEWKRSGNPEFAVRIQSQWNEVRSLYSPAQLSSADPTINGNTINALDDSALMLNYLIQVNEVTGDPQAQANAYNLWVSIQTYFADPNNSGCGLHYSSTSDPGGEVKQSEIIEAMIARSAIYLYGKLGYPALLTYAQNVWAWINSTCAQHPYGVYYEGSDLNPAHACYQQGIACADPSNIHIGGLSATYIGGEMEVLTLAAELYRMTGTALYLNTINSHLDAMTQNRTFLRPGSNVSLSGNVFLNDRDAWSDGIGAQAFAFEVLSLAGVDPTNNFKPVFINTALSIINSRTHGIDPSGFDDGYYTADWSGPEAIGQLTGGTPSSAPCPCTWAQRGVTAYSSSLASQFNPVITATAALSGTLLTVSSPSSPGTITVGQYVNGGGIPTAKYRIAAFGSGTGGAGTYVVSPSGTIASQSVSIGGNQYDYCCNWEAESNQLMTFANSGAMVQAAAMLLQGTAIH